MVKALASSLRSVEPFLAQTGMAIVPLVAVDTIAFVAIVCAAWTLLPNLFRVLLHVSLAPCYARPCTFALHLAMHARTCSIFLVVPFLLQTVSLPKTVANSFFLPIGAGYPKFQRFLRNLEIVARGVGSPPQCIRLETIGPWSHHRD